MARAARNDETPDEILLANTEIQPGEESVESKILAEFNQADDQDAWTIGVSRFLKFGQPEEFCFNCSPADFPIIERIQEKWGAGMYIVRLRRNGKIVRAFRYAVAAPRENPVAAVHNELGQISSTFQAALDRMSQMVERLVTQRGNNNGGGGNSPSITELMTAMVQMKEFVAPKERTGASELLQVFKLGIEAAGGAPVAEGTGILGSLERILSSPIIQKIAEGAMSAMPAPAAPGAPQPVPARVEAPRPNGVAVRTEPTATAVASPQEQQIQVFMRTQILYLLGRAHQWRQSQQTKSHPDLYAEWVVDNIPIEILGPVVNAPNPLELLSQFVPEVAGFADWFAQLLESVRAELTGAGEEGDNGDTLANGSNGARPHVSGATESGVGVTP